MSKATESQPRVPIEEFGADHWSLLGYIETRCVDWNCNIDFKKLRLNEKAHPDVLSDEDFAASHLPWSRRAGTRLKDGKTQLRDHDDIDCLSDLEEAGLIIRIGENFNQVKLTELGIKYAHRLRAHLMNRGGYKNFKFKEESE